MIRLPKYGHNIRRYADAAFDAAWREVVAIGIPGVREYLSNSNPECAVPFNVRLKFSGSGLIGATVTRIPPNGEFELIADHICPLWEIESQRRGWHSQVYRTVVHRYALERYGPASGKRPFYQMLDEAVTAVAVGSTDVGDNFVQHVGEQCCSMVARWELEHRARESNHARIERLGAQKESV